MEPESLAGVRRDAERIAKESGKAPSAQDWDLKGCAQQVRDSLNIEQGGLCAYCCGRVMPSPYDPGARTGMKVEHFVARSQDPSLIYEWSNLLGVCGGRYMWGGEWVSSCDDSRGNAPLHIHPAQGNPDPETAFRPTRDGRLEGTIDDATLDLKALNLNAEVHRRNRGAVINMLQLKLARDDSTGNIKRLLATATASPLPAYSFVAAWYLGMKLRCRGIT